MNSRVIDILSLPLRNYISHRALGVSQIQVRVFVMHVMHYETVTDICDDVEKFHHHPTHYLL